MSQRKCVPCEGGMPPLDEKVILDHLGAVHGWTLEADSITRDFTFKDFKEALAFVNKVGALAEVEGHHPDISLHNYKKVTIALTTHAAKGLTDNDFIMAAKINLLTA